MLPNVWSAVPAAVIRLNDTFALNPVGLNWNVPSPPTVPLTILIAPRLVLTNVHVTDSPGLTTIALTGLPSEQVALVRSQPLTAPSELSLIHISEPTRQA